MPQGPFKIVVAEPLAEEALGRLAREGEVVRIHPSQGPQFREQIEDCHALLVRTHVQVSADLMDAARVLKVIGRAGIGVDNIDTAAAEARNITVVHTPAASTQAVAELTVGFIITLLRKTAWAEERLRTGQFTQARDQLAQKQLAEARLGIIGLGRIGRRVAEICHRAFSTPVQFHDIRDVEVDPRLARPVTREQLLAESDVVSLHVPLTPLTRHLINAGTLSLMKKDALLVNTSRGSVVDGRDLADALRSGRLAAAAIDVFETEPPDPEDPLLHAPNCILTPHIGSRTASALAAMNDVVEDVIAVLHGRSPRFPYRG